MKIVKQYIQEAEDKDCVILDYTLIKVLTI